jgi:ribosomal protein S18 acetylase RimI-like enzyme
MSSMTFISVRRAGVDDAAALVRLRALMLGDMGVPVGADGAPWRGEALDWFAERLADKQEFAAFVVDDPELGVVSSAVGSCDHHAPGPTNLSGLHGHIFNVSTDPRRQRQGHARACLEALLTWFESETEVRVINLNSTPSGQALYEALGFAAPRFPALQLRSGDATGREP